MGAVLVLVVACTGDDHDIDTVAIEPDVTAIDLPGERASTDAGVEDPDSSAARLLEASLCERLISDDDVLDAFGSVPQAPPAATVELDDALAFVTCSWTVADPIHTIVLQVEVARDDVTRSLFASGRADPLGTQVEGVGLVATVSETGSWNVDVTEDVRFSYFPIAAIDAPDADRELVATVAASLEQELD